MRNQRAAACVALMVGTACASSGAGNGTPRPGGTDEEADAVRAVLADGFETSWNTHQPAAAVTPEKCVDEAVFINTTGGWVKGCQTFAALITPLHAPGGPFHDHTRRHAVEELRFVRPDVAVAVVRTFDIRRGGVPTTGEETRGLIVLSKEGRRWKVNALENTKIQAAVNGQR